MEIIEYQSDQGHPKIMLERMVQDWRIRHPGKKPIRLDREDAVQPAGLACVAAMQAAVAQLGCKGTFQGSGPIEGYAFLREAASLDYQAQGIALDATEILVTGGIRDGLASVLDSLAPRWIALRSSLSDPAVTALAARCGGSWMALDASMQSGWLPMPSDLPASVPPQMVYLTTPHPVCGTAYSASQLAEWVSYARSNQVLLVADASYQAFVQTEAVPHSIYQVEGAMDCAIELRSFATADGLAAMPCGLAVVPHALKERYGLTLDSIAMMRADRGEAPASYVAQRGAEAAFSLKGKDQAAHHVREAMANAHQMAGELRQLGFRVMGGCDSPFVWASCPCSWSGSAWANHLMEESGIVVMPGHVFGEAGSAWVRFSGYADRAAIAIAMRRIAGLLQQLPLESDKEDA